MIDRGLAASPTPDMPTATDVDVAYKVSREELWAVEMAAWFLEVAASSWHPMGGGDKPIRWLADAPTDNMKEWSAWANELRGLRAKLGEAS